MPTKEQIYVAASERISQTTAGLSGRPFSGVITSVSTSEEFMDVRSFAGKHKVRVLHPYVGSKHWHRVGPDAGQRVLLNVRLDTKETSAITYLGADARDRLPELRLAAYRKQQDHYRPMGTGEHEISSSGLAQVFLGRRSVADIRGGYVRGWYDQDTLEAGARAVTHVRQLHLNTVSAVGDEERFGGVTRPDPINPAFRKIIDAPPGSAAPPSTQNASADTDAIAAAAGEMPLPPTEPAKEMMYVLKTGSGNTLIDHREGHVTDDNGQFVKGKLAGQLRYNKKIYGAASAGGSGVAAAASTGSGSATYEEQVDDQGNLWVGLPQTANQGIKFEIPQGRFHVQSGTGTSKLELDGVAGTLKLSSTLSGEVRSETGLKIHSAKVSLGQTDAAIHKAIRTQVYKGAEKAATSALLGLETADQTINTVAGAGITALSSVFSAISLAPLCPGVLVSLMGIAQSIIPNIFHQGSGGVSSGKGQTHNAFGQAWDSYESATVEYSS